MIKKLTACCLKQLSRQYKGDTMSRVKCLSVNLLFIFLLMRVSIFADEYPIPKYPYDITTGDVDCDGDIDVIVGSNISSSVNDTISVFYNDGRGNFTPHYIEKENFHFLKCATIDNDNLPDLLTKNIENYSFVYYKNNGDGSFDESIIIHTTLSNHYEYIKISDTNDDGDNDIVFYKKNIDAYWGILHNNGYGEFTENVYFNTDDNIMHLDAGRINEDEYADIVLTTGDATPPRIFYNNGNGFVQDTLMTLNWHDCFIKDMNNDELNDIMFFAGSIFIGIPSDYVIAYNSGNEEFVFGDILELPPLSIMLDIADYNNDDYLDIVYHSVVFDSLNQPDVENIFICFNNQDGTFSEPDIYHIGPCMFGFKLTPADFDNNGYLDIAVTSRDLYHVRILFNDGTGNFIDEPQVGINEEYIMNNEKCKISNYPNPFNPVTTISYNLPVNVKNACIEIFNIKGEMIRSLNSFPNGCLGTRCMVWDGKDNYQNQVSSGVYLYRIKSDDFLGETKKMLLMK